MGGSDGIGDIVTGGILSGAVEPATGETGEPGTGACLNCGAQLDGRYCSNCGQKAKVNRSLTAFFADMAQQLLDVEGKVWRTLPMLAWKPGEMTRRYIDGERARFVSPVALYIFSVFAMFAVLSFNGALDLDDAKISTDIPEVLAGEEKALEKLEQARARAEARGVDLGTLEEEIAAQREEVAQLEKLKNDGFKLDLGDGEAEAPAVIRDAAERVRSDPQGFMLRVQDAASKYSWLLIPLSLPFVWLLFPFSRRFKFYDHTVFVTYSIAFMMFLVIAGGLMVAAGAGGWTGLLFLVPPVHLYKHVKGTYMLGWFAALWRTILLIVACILVLVLFALAMGAIGALS